MPIVTTAGGELESSKAQYVVCELEGNQPKIVEMLAKSQDPQVKRELPKLQAQVKRLQKRGLL